MKTNYRKEFKNYLDDLSQKGYQPGGGSAGALAFCLGVSLLVKAIRHTLGSKARERREKKLKLCLANFIDLKKQIYPYIDKDGEIFSKMIGGNQKNRARNLKQGSDLIKSLGRSACKVFSLAKGIESDIKKSIKSDFDLGLELVRVSALSAIFNLEANQKIFGKKEAYQKRLKAFFFKSNG